MEQAVPDEVQATMAVKLADNVRKLIRDEVKLALEDSLFMGQLDGYQLGEAIIRSGVFTSSVFREAVRQAMLSQMQKY